jgi:nitroreductase
MSQDSASQIKFLRSLRAVREYLADPISEDAIRDILDVARWSGSASNNQPVEVVIVRDEDVKRKITEGGVRAAAGSALAIVIVTPGDLERKDLEVFDDGRLVERLMLAASALGIGSNIGTLKGEGPSVFKRALGMPDERRVWSVVTLGHTDEAAFSARARNPRAGRKPVSAFAHWDRYPS